MSEPKRQHLVPRCYLKHFAMSKNKGWHIDACAIHEPQSNIFSSSIDNICVQKDFYTFRKLHDEHKRFLERSYSNAIEDDYTEIYNVLINPNVKKISDNMRFKIMSFIICQHFRTAKLTKTFNGFWNQVLEKGHAMIPEDAREKRIYLGDEDDSRFIDFSKQTLAEAQAESDEENREMVNLKNYSMFRDLTMRRINDGIAVYKVHPKHQLITSDNPVITGQFIFDPNISIKLPINSSHIVAIIPFHEEILFDNKTINRDNMDEERSYFQSTTNNMVQIEQCDQFILGKRTILEAAIEQSKTLDHQTFEKQCAE